LGFGWLDPSRAGRLLDRLAGAELTADWGVRILARSHPAYNPVGYHEGSVWPLFSGWAALAEYRLHRPRSAFLHLAQTLANYRDGNLGAIEEVLHGEIYRSRGITSHQAWSESLPLQATLEGMLGAEPDALGRRLRLSPHFPPSWNRARVGPLRVGEGELRFVWSDEGASVRFEFASRGIEGLALRPGFPAGTEVLAVRQNGSRRPFHTVRTADDLHLEIAVDLSSPKNEVVIELQRGPTLEAPLPPLVFDQPSRGLRLIRELFGGNRFEARLEGVAGEHYAVDAWDFPPRARWEGARLAGQEGRRAKLQLVIPEGGAGYREVQVTASW
jgi:hypothetical protein